MDGVSWYPRHPTVTPVMARWRSAVIDDNICSSPGRGGRWRRQRDERPAEWRWLHESLLLTPGYRDVGRSSTATRWLSSPPLPRSCRQEPGVGRRRRRRLTAVAPGRGELTGERFSRPRRLSAPTRSAPVAPPGHADAPAACRWSTSTASRKLLDVGRQRRPSRRRSESVRRRSARPCRRQTGRRAAASRCRCRGRARHRQAAAVPVLDRRPPSAGRHASTTEPHGPGWICRDWSSVGRDSWCKTVSWRPDCRQLKLRLHCPSLVAAVRARHRRWSSQTALDSLTWPSSS